MMYAVLSTDTHNTLKHYLVTVKLSFTVKMIDCMYQTGPTGRKLERLGMSITRDQLNSQRHSRDIFREIGISVKSVIFWKF